MGLALLQFLYDILSAHFRYQRDQSLHSYEDPPIPEYRYQLQKHRRRPPPPARDTPFDPDSPRPELANPHDKTSHRLPL